MGKRFSVRLQLQPDVLGKMWDTPTCFPAPAAIPEPQFFLFFFFFFCVWDFVVTVGTRGELGVLQLPPQSTVKNKSLMILSPKIPAKAQLFSRGGRVTNPSCCAEPPSPSPVPVLVPSIQVGWGLSHLLLPLAAAFPNPLFFPNPFFPSLLRLRRAELPARS